MLQQVADFGVFKMPLVFQGLLCYIFYVPRAVPVDALMVEVEKMAAKIAAKPAMAVKVTKMLINTGSNVDLESALRLDSQSFGLLFSTEDEKEGGGAFLEKRPPLFQGRLEELSKQIFLAY